MKIPCYLQNFQFLFYKVNGRMFQFLRRLLKEKTNGQRDKYREKKKKRVNRAEERKVTKK